MIPIAILQRWFNYSLTHAVKGEGSLSEVLAHNYFVFKNYNNKIGV